MWREEEEQFRTAVRSFVTREISPRVSSWERDCRYPREIIQQLGELGWLGCGIPVALGGSGGGALMGGLLAAELAYGSAGVALGIYAHMALATAAIFRVGDEEQKRRWLRPAAQGETIGCWAYAEANAGADVTTVSLRAQRSGEKYVLNGAKLYVTNGPLADFAVVVAVTDPGKGIKGLSLFYVELDRPGVCVGPAMDKMGMRPSEMAEISFEDCAVPLANRLGAEHTGFLQAFPVISHGRIAAAASAVGLGRAALDCAVKYSQDRVQYGRPLAKQQYIRFTLAEMRTRLAAAWELTCSSARLADEGAPFDETASMAKLFATQCCTWIAERALHLTGAFGYMAESPAQRFYRDCKVFELGEGTTEIQRELIARAMGL